MTVAWVVFYAIGFLSAVFVVAVLVLDLLRSVREDRAAAAPTKCVPADQCRDAFPCHR